MVTHPGILHVSRMDGQLNPDASNLVACQYLRMPEPKVLARGSRSMTGWPMNARMDKNGDGHTMGSIVCGENGWSDTPTCHERECIIPDLEHNLIAHPRKEKYLVGDVLTFSCRNRTHSLLGPDSIQCYNFGWSPNPPTCKEATRCPPPPQIPNSQNTTLRVNYVEGETVTILCQENFLIQEGEEIVCQGGRWQSIPRCVEKTPCSEPPHVEHGSINLSTSSEDRRETLERKSYAHGTTLSYICKDGFKLSKEDGITCHLGKWSPSPQCVGLPCGPPPDIANADLSNRLPRYPHGQKYTYTCKRGFRIRGPASVECSGGNWSLPPECTTINCPSPPNYDNAYLQGSRRSSYSRGERVTYKCKEDYQMDGSSSIECRDGMWIGTPTCKDLSCGSPPPVPNAFLSLIHI